jgi:hypothetical protein
MTAAEKTLSLRIASLNEELAGCTTAAEAKCVRETLEATEAQGNLLVNGHWPKPRFL